MTPASNLECYSNDNRIGGLSALGGMLVVGGVTKALGWNTLWGSNNSGVTVGIGLAVLIGVGLIWIGLSRILRPGCQSLLRINHGGVTDFRLNATPIRWKHIQSASRCVGPIPALALKLDGPPARVEPDTLWARLIHLTARGANVRYILTFTLDRSFREVEAAIQGHLQNKNDNEDGS
jgi:hypothetical protein